jgi:dipeptidyl aminopeptidase/acylaminoacyl peptidase
VRRATVHFDTKTLGRIALGALLVIFCAHASVVALTYLAFALVDLFLRAWWTDRRAGRVNLRVRGLVCQGLLACSVTVLAQDFPRPEAAPKDWNAKTEDFFRYSRYYQLDISPNGQMIAALVPSDDGRRMLVAMDVHERKPWTVAKLDDLDITHLVWINDRRLILTVEDLKRGSGERESALAGVNIDQSDFVLFPGNAVFLAACRDGSDDVLASFEQKDHSFTIFRVNTHTGLTRSLVYGIPPRARSFLFDHQMRLRIVVTFSEDAKSETVRYRADEQSAWVKLVEFPIQHPEFSPAAFSADDKTLYVTASDGGDTVALFSYDVQGPKIGERLISVKGQDVRGHLIYDNRFHDLLGVRVAGRKPTTIWFDSDLSRLQASVDAALPNTTNSLYGGSRGNLLVRAYSDRLEGRYYLFDLGQRRLEELFDSRPWLNPDELSETRPINYAARDGLRIPAFLTLPHGRGKDKLPLIVDVHDGPHLEAMWGFDSEVQFLASLGYAVLVPNFRGSTGNGDAFFRAGWRNWGLKMEDDLTDGVEYLVAQGAVDRSRVCIMGTGYGGYAALMGVIREPGLFRCAIDRSGYTDLKSLYHVNFFEGAGSIYQQYSIREVLADPETMAEQLKQTSPIEQVSRIRAPVLLAYGSETRLIYDASNLRDALEHQHTPCEWLILPGEVFALRKEESRFRYYGAVEQFLRKYNPPDAAASTASTDRPAQP